MRRIYIITALVIVVLEFGAVASGSTYYVSSSGGNDTNNGTSTATAWQTVGKVNGQTFLPGDSILFRRGDVWNEGLVPASSGGSGNPITFDAYGSGAAPNLTGYYAVPAQAWVLVSGNAWKATLPAVYSTINFCLFGSVWGQKVAASTSNLQGKWDFYFANGALYVYSAGNPTSYYNTAIVPMALSNVPVIHINGKSWLTFQHFLVNWFDQYGVYVQGASDHLAFANMESDSMIPQGTQPLGFYVNESAPGPGDIRIYNAEAHLNYDGFRFDGAATAITLVNDKAYANRDGALVDNTGAVTYSYCHFYASSLAVASSTDVEFTTGTGPTAGAGNVPADTAPNVQAYQRYPAEVSLTLDDAGMTAGSDAYYANQVLPAADAAGVPVGAAVTVGYPLAQTLVSEFQGWVNAGRDVTSHSMSHTYYTNTDALEIQYTGNGSAAALSISGKTLTITVTGASDSVTYNLAQGQPQGTILGLEQALTTTGHFTATENPTCQGPYGTGCSAYTRAALLAQDLADVSSQDVKGGVYHMQLDVTRLTTDEITLSRQWMTSHLTGLPATAVYVYPGGYETSTMQGITAGVPYSGARGALKEDLGVKDTYASGFDVQNITSFGVNPTWEGLTASALNQKVQALVWKQMVWGVPWGIFWHSGELSSTEITNLIQSFQSSGSTIQSNTGLVNWLRAGTQETGTAGDYYYKFPAANMTLDFRPTASSPVVGAGQNLGSAYQVDINGVSQNSYGGWEIGAHAYVGYSAYGVGGGSYFSIGGPGTPVNCGPENNYDCLSTSTVDPGVIAPIFVSTAPTPTTVTGMGQNSTAFDTTINSGGVGCYTRLTDPTTFPNGKSVGNLTVGGGDDIAGSSVDEDYVSSTAAGGSTFVFHLDNSENCAQVLNTGLPAVSTGGGEFGFSRQDNHKYYKLRSSDVTLHEVIYNSDATAIVSDTQIFDFRTCPGLPQPFVPTWSTYLTIPSADTTPMAGNEQTFMTSLSNVGGQGTGIWAAAWNRTKGCTTVDMSSGTVYCDVGWGGGCPGGSTPLGNFPSTGCWGAGTTNNLGIHGGQGSLDGKYYWITGSGGGQWQGGACANVNAVVFSVWEVGTLGDQFCDGRTTAPGTNCSGHPSVGHTKRVASSWPGPNIRTSADVSTFTTFTAPTIVQDSHGSLPSPGGVDARYWVQASDLITTALVSPCAPLSAVYCPPYQMNSIFLWDTQATYPPGSPVKMVGHTFSCGDPGASYQHCTGGGDDYFGGQESIGYATQKGTFFVFGSSMLGTLGLDDQGKDRVDAFIVRLGKKTTGSLAASPMFGFSESSTGSSTGPR